MKSNICVLSSNKECLKNIFVEAEKALAYNNLQKQDALRLRLLAEEMVGLISELIDDFEGEFWIENKGSKYRLYASLNVEYMDKSLKDRLLNLATNKKNRLAKGIKGKILSIFENIALSISENGAYIPSTIAYNSFEEYSDTYSYAWSLNEYKQEVQTKSKQSAEWDELEKSIIANLADDVLVGVRKDKVEILIVKKFAE